VHTDMVTDQLSTSFLECRGSIFGLHFWMPRNNFWNLEAEDQFLGELSKMDQSYVSFQDTFKTVNSNGN